jgi:transposase
MMVGRRRRHGKASAVRFAAPPWDEDHPRWRQLDEELPEDHVAREVVAAMEWLDLKPLYDSYSASGSPPIRPDLMLRIVLIEMRQGRYRPAQWYRDTRENDPLKWAGMGIRPSRTAWYVFHNRVAPFLAVWNQEILETAVKQDITRGEQVSLDGSAIAANASRHRLVNEGTLAKRMQQLREAIAKEETGQPVEDAPGWMAKESSTRQEQLRRHERAKERLAELHAVNQRQDRHRRRPREKIVVSTSDPEAALGRDKFHVFRPLYNVQLLCDVNSSLILGYDVFAQATDAGTLKPMLSQVALIKGLTLRDLLADATYVTASNLALCEQSGVTLYGPWQQNDYSGKTTKKKNVPAKLGKDQFTWSPEAKVYVCPQGHTLKWIGRQKRRQADGEVNIMHSYRCSPEHCGECPQAPRCTTNPKRGRSVKRSEHEELIEAHRHRMASEEAKRLYKKRRQTVELGFADVKEHRHLRRFPRRGLRHAKTHVGLAVLANNLLIVHRATMTAQTQHEATLTCCV